MLFSYLITSLSLLFPMTAQTDIPSDFTDNGKAVVFQILDSELNSTILCALLHGKDWCSVPRHVDVDWCQAYTLAFSLSCSGIYVSLENLHYDTQAEINNIVISKCWTIRQAIVIVIILLYALILLVLLPTGHI